MKLNIVGVDALVIGSLTEFGRKTVGQSGFVSSSKKQVAFAKVDLRVVDVSTGQVIFATSGAGESSTESASTFGFGSQAAYDGTLNDSAIRLAVSEAVSRLSTELAGRPWRTALLSIDQGRYFVAGGKAQGVRPGMLFSVQTVGEKIRSPRPVSTSRCPAAKSRRSALMRTSVTPKRPKAPSAAWSAALSRGSSSNNW